MQQYRLGDAIDRPTVAAWQATPGDTLVFHASRGARCCFLVDETAAAKLYELQRSGVTIESRYTAPGTFDPFFQSMCGIALVSVSRRIMTPAGNDVRTFRLEEMWKRRMRDGGLLRGGRRTTLLARDPDSPIPPCLRSEGRSVFPRPNVLSDVLFGAGRRMSGVHSFGTASVEQDAVSVLYEAFLNSHEHARVNGSGRALPGFRGISVEKLIFARVADIEDNRRLPHEAKDYLRRNWERMANGMAMAITVSDTGPGIHNTLPVQSGESGWKRLVRAFQAGETRKPRGSSQSRGLGLSNVVDSCGRLSAWICVRSGQLMGSLDCSAAGGARSPWQHLGERGGSEIGTAVTMVWPVSDSGADQRWLFDAHDMPRDSQ